MNNVFRTAGAHDLTFEYHAGGQTVRGFVEYIGAPMGVPGTTTATAWWMALTTCCGATVVRCRTEVDAPGIVNAADYTAWRARFGNTSGSGSGLDRRCGRSRTGNVAPRLDGSRHAYWAGALQERSPIQAEPQRASW